MIRTQNSEIFSPFLLIIRNAGLNAFCTCIAATINDWYSTFSSLIVYNYKSIFPHVAAAIQLSNIERVSTGDNIEYVYADSQHQNPLSRVVPAQFIRNNDSLDYDKEKYKEMLTFRRSFSTGINLTLFIICLLSILKCDDYEY